MKTLKTVLAIIAFTVLSAQAVCAAPSSVWIEGVLLGPDGHPAREGFVMVRNNPYLNALTDEQGHFRLVGESGPVPDTLLASWAGSALDETPLWQRTRKKLTIHLLAEDPAFTHIEVGAALSTLYNGMHKEYYQVARPFSTAEQECVSAYQAFLKARGEGIIAQILTGNELTADDARYRYLLHAEIGLRSSWDLANRGTASTAALQHYRDTLLGRAKPALRRLWLRDPLSPDDLAVLRCFRAMTELVPGWGGMGAGWSSGAGFSQWQGHLGAYPLGVGQPLEANFLRIDPLFDAPAVSRYSSLTLTEFIRFEALAHLFAQTATETPAATGFAPVTPDALRRRFWHPYEQVDSMRDLCANGKPTFYLWTQLEDRTYPRWSIAFAEYIRRAYQGQVNTVISTTMSPNFGDMWADENMFYGPNPQRDPAHGRDSRPFEEDFTPLRAAQATRVACLEYPYLSAPLLWDPDGSLTSVRLPQSDNHLEIIDKSGLLCESAWDWQVLGVTGQWSNLSFYTTFSDALEGEFARKEQVLRAVIANHGRYVAGIDRQLLVPTYPRRQFTTRDFFIVRSVDSKAGIIHAGWFKPAEGNLGPNGNLPDNAATGDFRFRFAADTRIVLRRDEGHVDINHLDEVKPGLRFWADFTLAEPVDTPRAALASLTEAVHPLRLFDMARYADKEIDTVRIQNWERGMQADEYLMQLYGRLVARTGNIITVRIARDDLKAMYGVRFWQQDQRIAAPDRATGGLSAPVALYRATLRRWLDGTDADRTYRFALDRAVRVFRNGHFEDVTMADLQVGDYVWATYETFWETEKRYREAIYPERIYASTPVVVPKVDHDTPVATAPAAPRPVDAAIAFAAHPITLDGDLSDWAGVAPMPAPFMKRDSSMLRFLWSTDGLYGAAQITDTDVKTNAAQPWTGDCLELWIEKDNAKGSKAALTYAQYIFAPPASGLAGDTPLVQIPRSGIRDVPEEIRCNWQKTAMGYNLEFFIPAKLLAPAVMRAGTRIGLNACIDDDGKAIEQLMADKGVNNGFRNPAAWGTVEFKAAVEKGGK